MSAMPAPRCSTGCSPGRWAANSCCGSTTPMRRAPPRNLKRRSIATWTGWGCATTCADRQINRLKIYSSRFLQTAGCGPHLSLLRNRSRAGAPARAAGARASCRRSMTAPRSTRRTRRNGKPKAASPIGASSCRARRWAGPIWCAGRWRSTPPPCPIRCWCARTAPFSTPCRRWPMTWISPSAMWCAARTMSPTPPPRSRSSRRWAQPVPAFAHFPLLVGAGGEALSKRLGSLSLQQLARRRHRAAGGGVLSRQDRHLRSRRAAPVAGRAGAANSISPRSAGRRRISMPEELTALNAKLLHMLPYSAVQLRRVPDIGEALLGRDQAQPHQTVRRRRRWRGWSPARSRR